LRRVQWLKDETDLAANREILAALLRSDIEVKGDYNPKIFHQKFVLRDYEGKASTTSALLSGSANFTWSDTHVNLNNVFILRNAYVCRPPGAAGGSTGRCSARASSSPSSASSCSE
jgi:hypothetical protein